MGMGGYRQVAACRLPRGQQGLSPRLSHGRDMTTPPPAHPQKKFLVFLAACVIGGDVDDAVTSQRSGIPTIGGSSQSDDVGDFVRSSFA